MRVVHIPLESLRAETAEQFREFEHVVIVSSAAGAGSGSVGEPGLNAARRCWQACVRLRRVYGLKQAAILDVLEPSQ